MDTLIVSRRSCLTKLVSVNFRVPGQLRATKTRRPLNGQPFLMLQKNPPRRALSFGVYGVPNGQLGDHLVLVSRSGPNTNPNKNMR